MLMKQHKVDILFIELATVKKTTPTETIKLHKILFTKQRKKITLQNKYHETSLSKKQLCVQSYLLYSNNKKSYSKVNFSKNPEGGKTDNKQQVYIKRSR